jgi:tetratricopeptide (TPR) repeat protein
VPPISSRLFIRSASPGPKCAADTRRLAGVLLAALLLGGCATPPQTRSLLAAPPTGLPDAVELTDTPFYPQERYQCGPAALATVLAAHAVDVTPGQLEDALFVPALNGSLPEEIAATARRYAMLAYRLQPSLENLLAELAHGNPVLVFQNLGTDWLARWHFAVIIGYDLATREVVLRSGTTRRWRTTLATFERTWARSGYWALVVLPAGSIPASARPLPYLEAAHDLEISGQAVAARASYQAATRRWPREPHVWLALGNSLYAGADYARAETAFREATHLAPADSQGWNNLAYALMELGCPIQARAAAACAVGLAPDEPNYRDTAADIGARTSRKDAPHCLPVMCKPPT